MTDGLQLVGNCDIEAGCRGAGLVRSCGHRACDDHTDESGVCIPCVMFVEEEDVTEYLLHEQYVREQRDEAVNDQ